MTHAIPRLRSMIGLITAGTLLLVALASPSAAVAAPTLLSLNQPVRSSGINAEKANDADASNTGGFFDAALAGGQDAWWQVDLGDTYSLSQIVNRNYVDGSRYYHYYVRTSLDGEHWSAPIAWKYNNAPASAAGETFAVTGVARYVRVNIIHNSANSSAHLTNFEVYGTAISQTVAATVDVATTTSSESYETGETPQLQYTLHNTSAANVTVAHAYAIVFGLSDPTYRRFTEIETQRTLAAGVSRSDSADLWEIDGGMPVGAYGVFVRTQLSDGSTWEEYETFFRVNDGSQLTTFDVAQQNYSSFPVYTLDGGLSAEYAVQKSAQILSQSAGPSWTPSAPGYGPRPVYATPSFLQKTIGEAIATLDGALGSTRPFDTLLIAPGIQSTPQLIRTLQAPVLPLHFLVSFDSVYELQTVLDEAQRDGYEVMATMGFDGSMDPGVAWIKLLEPPAEYLSFAERHSVQNVVIAGSEGSTGGENASRRVQFAGAATTGHNAGDIFVIYPGGGSSVDVSNLAQRVHDVSDLPLAGSLENISDWEAGLLPEQVAAFSTGLSSVTTGNVATFTAPSYYDIDNMGVYLTAAFYHKNETALAVDGEAVRGISLSPYMTNQPFADSAAGLIPVLFFQGESSLTIVEGRILNITQNALDHYFPGTDVKTLPVDVITSRNFGGFANAGIESRLQQFGFTSWDFGTTGIDEVWDPADGYTAWNETAVTDLAAQRTQGEWTTWNNALDPLDFSDLTEIATTFPNIEFTLQ